MARLQMPTGIERLHDGWPKMRTEAALEFAKRMLVDEPAVTPHDVAMFLDEVLVLRMGNMVLAKADLPEPVEVPLTLAQTIINALASEGIQASVAVNYPKSTVHVSYFNPVSDIQLESRAHMIAMNHVSAGGAVVVTWMGA